MVWNIDRTPRASNALLFYPMPLKYMPYAILVMLLMPFLSFFRKCLIIFEQFPRTAEHES